MLLKKFTKEVRISTNYEQSSETKKIGYESFNSLYR